MPAIGLRRIRVGLLGLGTVGQAVAQAAAHSARDGVDVSIECALVRDVARRRRAPGVARITDNAEGFLRGRYDVVIDALAGREPAATLAARLLGRGVPVVSANKAMLAADGPRLRRVAARAGASLRVEAAVMAGVPFIGGLERRPLAGRAARFAGVLNGTSHFAITRMAEGLSLDAAIAEAQARGFAEPDPEADVSGADARDKLVVLAAVLLDAAIAPRDVAVDGIGDLTPADLGAAACLGGVIKPVAFAARGPRALAAFVGPAWVPARHPLAGISGVDNAIVIEGRHIPRLLFAGPGAGAGVTAATLIDDAVEAVEGQRALCGAGRDAASCRLEAPRTGWFARVSSPGRARDVAAGLGGAATRVAGDAARAWAIVPPADGDDIPARAAALASRGAALRLWRALDVPAR